MGSRRKEPSESSDYDPALVEQPGSLYWLIQRWEQFLSERHYAAGTVRNRRDLALPFAAWCAARAVVQASAVTRPLIERYQRHLYHLRTARDASKPLSVNYQVQRIAVVQYLFRWAVRQGHVGANPAADIDRPRPVRRLPDHLAPDEVAAVFAVPDVSTAAGLRDRAILEVLYSTGMRRAECAALSIYDLDRGRGLVRILQGKGGKDRYVPIGAGAVAWLTRYEQEVRAVVAPPGEATLILADDGARFSANALGQIVRRLLSAAGISKPGACHLFRHTMATALLEGGCDVRLVQEMLGHAKLDTTALYTHVSVQHLKRAHRACHPGEQPPSGG